MENGLVTLNMGSGPGDVHHVGAWLHPSLDELKRDWLPGAESA